MRIVFMGTPAFAVPSLDGLVRAGHRVVGAFTQPDKPVGRHQNKLKPTPVKELALSLDIPVFQPVTLRDGAAAERLRALAPELIVVAAYGRILPDEILALPPKGCINVHSSLLPKYRGAAPINWAILNGEEATGVTIMHVAAALDAGDVIAQTVTPIDKNETAQALYDRLAVLGAELLVKTVEYISNGTAKRVPQEEGKATLAPMLSRELSPMDFSRPARQLHDQVRGLYPWPAASTDVLGEPVKVFSVTETGAQTVQPSGSVLAAGKDGIDVSCGDGKVLRILELQAAGGRRMSAADYLMGHTVKLT